MGKAKIIKDAIRRFNHLPNRTIAQHILSTYPDFFDNDLEKVRTRVRYYRGRQGKGSRKDKNKQYFIDGTIKIPKTWRKVRTPYKLSEGLWLVLSDLHIPYHEPKAIEAAIQQGQAEKVNGIFINGDLQDCAAVSYWYTLRRDFNAEIDAVIDFLDWLRQEFPKQKIVYKPGNHEYRLPRYYLSKAPELADTPYASMDAVLNFSGRNIEFLDYYQIVHAGLLPIIHGHEIRNISIVVNPARGLFNKIHSYGAISHCHSTSTHAERNIEGVDLTCHSFGCLCDLHPDYDPYNAKWNHGFALINVEKNGDFEVVNRRILPSGQVV